MSKHQPPNRTAAVDPEAIRQGGHQSTPFMPAVTAPSLATPVAAVPIVHERAAPTTLGSMICRQPGGARLVLVAKACYSLASSPMKAAFAPAIFPADVHHKKRVGSHLVAPSDLIPGRPLVDVVATGQACMPEGETASSMTATFSVFQGGQAGFEKSLRIVGDRKSEGDKPAPFAKMPITYERAVGGPASEDNPIGVDLDDGELPNVVHPKEPKRPVGFGAIAAFWPVRRNRLPQLDPKTLSGPEVTLPQGFDWRFFQSAPEDQRLRELDPDATIVLEGFHPTRSRIAARFPSIKAVGVVFGLGADPSEAKPLAFRADTVCVDAERLLVSVSFRANVALDDTTDIASVLFQGCVQEGDEEIPLPTAPDWASVVGGAQVSSVPSTMSKGATLGVEVDSAPVSLPFGKTPPKREATMVLEDALPPAVPEVAPPVPEVAPPVPEVAPSVPEVAPERPQNRAPQLRPRDPDAPKISDLYHDPKKLSAGAPVEEAAAASVRVAPKPWDRVHLEACAKIDAALMAGVRSASAIFAEHDATRALTRPARRHWMGAIEARMKLRDFSLRDRYDDAFVTAWETELPGRFSEADYHRLSGEERHGVISAALDEAEMSPALWRRLARVWSRRLAATEDTPPRA